MEATLLVELLTEELPPKSLGKLAASFSEQILAGLRDRGLVDSNAIATMYATPRRIAVRISNVIQHAADRELEVTGPSVKAGIDQDGKPTPALIGFAKKNGVTVESLTRASTPKGEVLVAKKQVKGASLDEALAGLVEDSLKRLPIPKMMRWGSGDAQFVRPVHGLVMLHGERVVPGTVLDIVSSNRTCGHRFMSKGEIRLAQADDYEGRLEADGCVIADFAKRRALIESQLNAEAARQNAKLGPYKDLLDEVTALVEHPSVYTGAFDAQFLEVPQECLILTMQQNQKYFPLFDPQGKLLPKFLIVSNMRLADSSNVVQGNQRVVRPRLEDARFFYRQDRKTRLEERVPQLAKVVYHNKLGSQLERVERVQLLAGRIAEELKADGLLAKRAAWLCKADLLSGMVGEFPELQGIMGRYYALHDGEPPLVADAIDQHYRPRFAGDQLPQNPVSSAVALADKLDTLIGIFGIGLLPTGDKDPFGLRRQALGVLRILCEQKLPLDVAQLLKLAHHNFPKGVLLESHAHGGVHLPNYVEAEFFVKERAKGYLRDLGYSPLEIEAVLDLGPMPAEYVSRLDAARSFLSLPEAAGLAEADKRIRNILSKSGGASVVQAPDEAKFQIDAEGQLLRTTKLLRKQVDSLVAGGQFTEALLLTAQVHAPVTIFFDKVMVNVEDESIRMNRFALLHEVVNLTNRVANISKLAA